LDRAWKWIPGAAICCPLCVVLAMAAVIVLGLIPVDLPSKTLNGINNGPRMFCLFFSCLISIEIFFFSGGFF